MKAIITILIISYIKSLITIDLIFEYPYTCGTWFNRGKNTIKDIISKLESNGIKVNSTIKPFQSGNFPKEYNGEFNIILHKGNETLVATSDKESPYYHSGLKYFAYTFYKYNNGEKTYLEEYPQKQELLNYVFKRLLQILQNE